MAKRKKREQTIFFPWEKRSGLLKARWMRSRALVAALGMVLLLLYFGLRERTRTGIRSTRATLLVVREAIDAYRADHAKKCPTSLGSLKDEGYLKVDPIDAWGRPLVLTCPGRSNPEGYDLVSYGPSGDVHGLDRVE